MRKIFVVIFATALMMSFVACDELFSEDGGLSENEVVEGLKTALEVGADSASTVLAFNNGYYGNELVKILLPDEAIAIQNTINGSSTLKPIADGLQLNTHFENVVKSINRAAEDAAKEASPIFKSAITDLTIAQGWDILNGTVPSDGSEMKSTLEFDSTAATQYLKLQTYDDLTALYAPKISLALDKDLGLGFSANDAWNTLTTQYNSFTNNTAVQLAISFSGVDLPRSIATDIGTYSTQKALDGLFYKVGIEEKKIRKNPFDWALDILRKVFG